MLQLILLITLLFIGSYLLEEKLKVRKEDIHLMWAGALLFDAVDQTATLIATSISGTPTVSKVLVALLSIALSAILGALFLKKSGAV